MQILTFKKLFSIAFLVFFLFPFSVKAATTFVHPDNNYFDKAFSSCVKGEIAGECVGKNILLTFFASSSCELDGKKKFCGDLPPGQEKAGVIPSLAGVIGTMYTTPPANLALWIRETGQSLGFIPKSAYAQGIGFTGLAPLIGLWRVFRNISYVLLSLSIIVVGFMIMFRRKIDPQTVVTIQEALPKIIITLILITFSYAIVGLLIDLMYVILLAGYTLFLSASSKPELFVERGTNAILHIVFNARSIVRDVILTGNLGEVFGIIFPGNVFEIMQVGSAILGDGPVGIFAGGVLGGFLLNILILILFIRLIFLFLGAYIQIVLSLVFGPIQILMGVLPGVDGFGNWIKNVVGNLSVFVIGGLMFMLSIFFSITAQQDGNQALWLPPYSYLWSGTSDAVASLFAVGVLMLIPNLANQFKQSIKSSGGVSMGGAFSLGSAWSIGSQIFGYVQAKKYHEQEIAALRGKGLPQQVSALEDATGGGGHPGK